MNKINEVCPYCNSGFLQLINEYYPCSLNYLKCNKCDSTYALNYKPLWAEDVSSLTCKMINILEDEFNERNIEITDDKLDELFNYVEGFLEQFGTGDYRHQM